MSRDWTWRIQSSRFAGERRRLNLGRRSLHVHVGRPSVPSRRVPAAKLRSPSCVLARNPFPYGTKFGFVAVKKLDSARQFSMLDLSIDFSASFVHFSLPSQQEGSIDTSICFYCIFSFGSGGATRTPDTRIMMLPFLRMKVKQFQYLESHQYAPYRVYVAFRTRNKSSVRSLHTPTTAPASISPISTT